MTQISWGGKKKHYCGIREIRQVSIHRLSSLRYIVAGQLSDVLFNAGSLSEEAAVFRNTNTEQPVLKVTLISLCAVMLQIVGAVATYLLIMIQFQLALSDSSKNNSTTTTTTTTPTPSAENQ